MPADAPLAGQRVGSIEWPRDTALVAILRDGRVIVPSSEDPLEAGDELLFVTSQDVEGELARAASRRLTALPLPRLGDLRAALERVQGRRPAPCRALRFEWPACALFAAAGSRAVPRRHRVLPAHDDDLGEQFLQRRGRAPGATAAGPLISPRRNQRGPSTPRKRSGCAAAPDGRRPPRAASGAAAQARTGPAPGLAAGRPRSRPRRRSRAAPRATGRWSARRGERQQLRARCRRRTRP